MTGRTRYGAAVALAALCAGGAALAGGNGLYYRVEGGEIVFTNVPQGTDAREVPGVAGAAEPRARDGGRVELPATPYDAHIELVARESGLSPRLIKAVALVESGFDPQAVSPRGARGLMQLMPATARVYGVRDAFDPGENLRAGARHLRELLDQFDGDLSLALAAYNAGAGAVRRHGGVPSYPETREYVRRVRERLGQGEAARPAPVRLVRASDGTLRLEN